MNSAVFRQYDIRGIAEKELSGEFALSLGRAYGALLREKNPGAATVSVGRDVRLSSEELASCLTEGLASTGLNVIDTGICPTPLQYFSLFHLDLDGGIMVTGSHNPPEYNGFKISIGKETIHGQEIQRLREIIEKAETEVGARGRVEKYDIIGAYKRYMLEGFSYLSDRRFRRLKVVVDAGNGTAGPVVSEILEALGCDVIPLYCEPDGRFPHHHPDPTVVENIRDLIRVTRETGADMGIGYDGDADRIGVVDREGGIIWGDQLMVILSRDLLRRNPGATVIADVKCSQFLFDDIRKKGGVPVMGKTGHSLVKQRMKEEGALLAGEFSGHIFIKDGYFGFDDAIYTTVRLIEIMKKSGKGLTDLLSGIPKMHSTPEIRMDCPDDRKREAVERVVARLALEKEKASSPCPIRNLDTTDGVRVAFDRGWGLVRMSNTQPVVVMRVEAEDEESLNRYRSFLEETFQEVMEGA